MKKEDTSTASDDMSPVSQEDGPSQGPVRAPFPAMHMLSNFFFVMGSVLYLWLSVVDYQWSLELDTLPMYVRVADDDITWANYRIEERHNESLMSAGVGRFLQSLDQYLAGSTLPPGEEEEQDGEDGDGGNFSSIGNYTNTDNTTYFTSMPSLVMESTLAPSTLPELEGISSNNTTINTTDNITDTDAMTSSPTSGPVNTPLPTAAPTITAPTTLAPVTSPPVTLAPATTAPVVNGGSSGTIEITPAPSAIPVPTQPAPPTPAELYYDEWWADLPPEIQAAYAVLGYNEDLWNNGGSTATDDKAWDELTDEEREAAETIGYTRLLWDGETLAPTTTMAPNDTADNSTLANNDGSGDSTSSIEPDMVEPGYYDDYYWNELPPEIQQAAITLGYDETIWNTGGYATSESLSWDELTPEQQEAAGVFGYDQYAWDGVDPNTGEVVAEDDYVSEDDDYVFHVEGADTYVSEYQIIYFCAAWCFVFMGALDLVREKHFFHILMIVAGLFGVASAMLVEEEVRISNILNSVSVHLYLLEGIAIFGNHKREAMVMVDDLGGNRKCLAMALALADIFFALGALIDAVLSYFYLLDDASDWNTELLIVGMAGGSLWLITSLVYVSATIMQWQSGVIDVSEEERDFQVHDMEKVVDVDELEDDAAKAGERNEGSLEL